MNYTVIDYALMFVSNFFVVFLLGLQSKNVNQSRYLASVVTSLGISIGQFLFIKYAAAGDFLAFGICATGGCSGIAFSIWFYDRFMRKEDAPEQSESTLVDSIHTELRESLADLIKSRQQLIATIEKMNATLH